MKTYFMTCAEYGLGCPWRIHWWHLSYWPRHTEWHSTPSILQTTQKNHTVRHLFWTHVQMNCQENSRLGFFICYKKLPIAVVRKPVFQSSLIRYKHACVSVQCDRSHEYFLHGKSIEASWAYEGHWSYHTDAQVDMNLCWLPLLKMGLSVTWLCTKD